VHFYRLEAEAARHGSGIPTNNQHCTIMASHASAQALILFARIARKHFLTNVSLESLNRIHTIPKVPVLDCSQKIREQLKCYLLQHALTSSENDLNEGLGVIEATNLSYFARENNAEFYALKGKVLDA